MVVLSGRPLQEFSCFGFVTCSRSGLINPVYRYPPGQAKLTRPAGCFENWMLEIVEKTRMGNLPCGFGETLMIY